MTHFDHIFAVEVDGDNQHGITTGFGFMRIYAHVCSHMRIYAHICSYMRIYAHICSYMRIYAHICACMLIYAHTCANTRICAWRPESLGSPPPWYGPDLPIRNGSDFPLEWDSTRRLSLRLRDPKFLASVISYPGVPSSAWAFIRTLE